MAIYDVTDMDEMLKEPYTALRKEPMQTQRERDTMKQITVDRRFYDLLETKQVDDFKLLEDVDAGTQGNVLVAVSLSIHPGKKEELDKWYTEEHIPMLSKVPGWQRTRRFVSSSIEPKDESEYLALHEYKPENGLGGEEFKAATSTPWNEKIMKDVVREKRRRVYDLAYTFGSGPRDLSSLSSDFVSGDRKTRTIPASGSSGGAIESYVTTKDGAVLPYRLEGSADANAPLIVLSNSILVDYGIWDGFVAAFFSIPENKKYRVVRYLTRGRSNICGQKPVTVDVLASDIIALLDALRVQKAAAVIGVSLGGATALNVGLKYPGRVASFVSCDTSSKSPAGNAKAWGDRIATAEKEGSSGSTGERVVGEQLAEVTVRRWFVPESYDGGNLEAEIARVKSMVQNNSLEGFKKSVEALFEYDMKAEMKEFTGEGLFVVGGGDGVLPGTMKEMAASLGKGAGYVVIDGAGHLPMVEKPQQFAEAVTKFLSSQ